VRRGTRFLYPQRSWEEFGGIFLDHHAYLKPKDRGNKSMREKHWCPEDVEGQVMQDPHSMVKAELLETQFPVGATLLPSIQHL
jgi:hypothetical protein